MIIPNTGIVSQAEGFKNPPIKLAKTANKADKRIPKFLFRKLPVTSLGELSKAPSAKARPTSKYPTYTPTAIGTMIPKARIIALVKSVLFKKNIDSL